jgi:hypothetical protein
MNNVSIYRMVNKYRDDPWTMQHLNRRFYSEKVFDDSNLHRPIISLQYRNSFGDNVAYGQRTHDSDSHDDSHSDSGIKRDDVESKKVPVSALTKYSYLNIGMTTLLVFAFIIKSVMNMQIVDLITDKDTPNVAATNFMNGHPSFLFCSLHAILMVLGHLFFIYLI